MRTSVGARGPHQKHAAAPACRPRDSRLTLFYRRARACARRLTGWLTGSPAVPVSGGSPAVPSDCTRCALAPPLERNDRRALQAPPACGPALWRCHNHRADDAPFPSCCSLPPFPAAARFRRASATSAARAQQQLRSSSPFRELMPRRCGAASTGRACVPRIPAAAGRTGKWRLDAATRRRRAGVARSRAHHISSRCRARSAHPARSDCCFSSGHA